MPNHLGAVARSYHTNLPYGPMSILGLILYLMLKNLASLQTFYYVMTTHKLRSSSIQFRAGSSQHVDGWRWYARGKEDGQSSHSSMM